MHNPQTETCWPRECATVGPGLPIPVYSIKTAPHRHVHRPARPSLYLILGYVRLTVKANHTIRKPCEDIGL